MFTRTVILLCAGDGFRWGNYLGVPKQLIPFHGEPLLHRTVRQLVEFGHTSEIVCVSCDSRLSIPGTLSFKPEAYRWTVETLLSSRPLWKERTIILLGDVFFAGKSLHRILDCTNPIAFFGRPWPSVYSGCNHGEIFAVSFSNDGMEAMLRGAGQALRTAQNGSWGNFWDLYYATARIELGSNHTETRLFKVLDDITNDFDTPKDYLRVFHRYRYASSPKRLYRLLVALWLSLLFPWHMVNKTLRLGAKPRKSPEEYYRSRAQGHFDRRTV